MSEIVDGKVTGPRGARITKRWEPKEWLPIYEAIVALSCTGLSNEVVGARFGYGKQQVSNILNTPQGKKLKLLIAERIRNENSASVVDRVAAIQEKALQRVEAVMFDDDRAEKQPLAIFDRSMEILKSGLLKDKTPIAPDGNNTHIDKAVFINMKPEQIQQLDDGLRKADQVRVIHSGTVNETKP